MPYQVQKWDATFENHKSRERDRCQYVCVPNRRGLSLAFLLAEPDGTAILGCFELLIKALSCQCRPRGGWLTDNGHSTGRAWAPSDLAMMFGRPVAEFDRMLKVLSTDRIGWIKDVPPAGCPDAARQTPAGCPDPVEERKKERKKEDGQQTGTPAPDEPAAPTKAKTLGERVREDRAAAKVGRT
jgi:hypothetical protein